MNKKQEKRIYILATFMVLMFTILGYYMSFTLSKPGEPFWVIYLIPILIGLVLGGPFFLLPLFIKSLFYKIEEKEKYTPRTNIVTKMSIVRDIFLLVISVIFVKIYGSYSNTDMFIAFSIFLLLYIAFFFATNNKIKD